MWESMADLVQKTQALSDRRLQVTATGDRSAHSGRLMVFVLTRLWEVSSA